MEKYQFFALIIITIFYVSYLLKGLILSQRGIKVNQMGYGKKSCKTKIIELALKYLTFLMAVLQLCIVFSLLPSQIRVSNNLQNIGIIISICGTICFITAMLTMGKSWRAGIATGESTIFVKHGIYRISRNPAFLGFYLFYIGILLVFPQLLHTTAVCITIILFHLQILEEEKSLSLIFGDEYLKYKQITKRYFLFF